MQVFKSGYRRWFGVVAVWMLMVTGPAWAGVLNATITVGDHLLQPNQANQSISILISGGDQVKGLNFYLQVGDGGPELANYDLPAGTPGPKITSVDLKTGTIYQSVTDVASVLESIPQVATLSFPISTPGVSVTADGLLATVVLDTTGFFSGTFPLLMNGVLNFPEIDGPYTSDFEGIVPTIVNGSITIVPEPTGVSLLLLTGALMARRVRHV